MAAKSSQFLKITDQSGKLVEGECIDNEHYNEVDISDWSWNLTDPSAAKKASTDATPSTSVSGSRAPSRPAARTSSTGTSGGTGDRITPSRFSFSKHTDKSSVRLLAAMDKGEVFRTVELSIEEEYQEQPGYVPFRMHIVLTDAFVVDLTWRVTAADARVDMDEDWELNYSQIRVSYLYRGKDGKGWIDVVFERPPESEDSGTEKSPLSAAELKAAEKKRFEDLAKSSGWTPPAKK